MELIKWEKAKQAIMECKTIDEVKEIRDKAEALRMYAKQSGESLQVQNNVAEIKIRADKRIGEISRDLPTNQFKGLNNVSLSHDGGTTKTQILKDAGIKHHERFEAIANLPEDLFEQHIEKVKRSNTELTSVGLLKAAKDFVKQVKRTEQSEAARDIKVDVDFRLGDFEEVFADIPDGSVDCIITDPPYPKEFIECWTKLSRFAKRVLKPNGFCIAYSGQMNLPEVMNRMSENLTYYWTFSLIHTGSRQLINGRSLFCGWKPILIFQNGFKKLETPFDDFIMGSGMEKTEHKWQQGKDELRHLIENFTRPGDLIIEPFAGGGTTIIAALELKRNIKAAEIDEDSYNITKSRVWKSWETISIQI